MLSQMMKLDGSDNLYEQALLTLRRQLWTGVMLFVMFAQFSTRLVRYLSGVESTTVAVVIQVIVYIVVILGLLLRNSSYAHQMQTVFLICMHLVVPTVTLLYGGVRGFGDIALLGSIMLTAVYGWRRWMYATFLISIAVFAYALYLELIGQPLDSFLNDTARFAAIKLLLLVIIFSTILWIGYRFYSRLVMQHQSLVDEQLRLTAELQLNTQQLTEISADLAQSRQTIVTAREEERRRLRRELQDQVAPSLAALRLRTGAARNVIRSQSADAKDNLNALENDIKLTLGDVRRFVYALHPPVLDQLGLVGAIGEHVRKLNAPFSVELDLPDETVELPASAEISIFQLLQTTLELAQQRDTTSHVAITLTVDDVAAHLTVSDDGIDDLAQLTATPAMQLTANRLSEVGGTLHHMSGIPAKLQATIPI